MNLRDLKQQAQQDLASVHNSQELENWRIKYLEER